MASAPLAITVCADSVIAQPAFEALLQGGWVAGLCTSRASTSGRNLRHLAAQHAVPMLEADRASVREELPAWLGTLRTDVLLTFAFPYRLPRAALDVPTRGAFNVHGGRLPEYRGPQPVFWQILNQELEGAVMVHRMDDAFDHGPVVAAMTVPIAPEDTYGLHVVRLAFAAVRVVEQLIGGVLQYGAALPSLPQDDTRARYRPRPTPDDLTIRWDSQPGDRVRALVKASNPWHNGAITTVRGLEIRVADATLRPGAGDPQVAPGTVLVASETAGLIVNCCDGSALAIDVVSMDEGILPGAALARLGITAGERFVAPERRHG